MSLHDLLKPKWRHSVPEVRLSAVDALSDTAVLVRIAKKDTDDRVRDAALRKLVGILHDKEVQLDLRLATLKEIDDQRVIEEIALDRELHGELRETAVGMLVGQDALHDVARDSQNDYVSYAAVERLEDRELLQDIADSDPRPGVRGAACDMLASKSIQRFLAGVVNGPAVCLIPIWKFEYLYYALAARLRRSGLTTSQIVDAVNKEMLGVCPACATSSTGQVLSLKVTYGQAGGVILTGNTGGLERLMEETCGNRRCHSRNILIFWRPPSGVTGADLLRSSVPPEVGQQIAEASARVVVGKCQKCGRPLRVKPGGVREQMRLTCKCGAINTVTSGNNN